MSAKAIATLFVFASDSSPGKSYQALLYTDGSTSCECPSWKFKKRTLPNGERTCKHVRDIDAGLGESHALKVVRYAQLDAAAYKRSVIRAGLTTGARAGLVQPELTRTRKRFICLED